MGAQLQHHAEIIQLWRYPGRGRLLKPGLFWDAYAANFSKHQLRNASTRPRDFLGCFPFRAVRLSLYFF